MPFSKHGLCSWTSTVEFSVTERWRHFTSILNGHKHRMNWLFEEEFRIIIHAYFVRAGILKNLMHHSLFLCNRSLYDFTICSIICSCSFSHINTEVLNKELPHPRKTTMRYITQCMKKIKILFTVWETSGVQKLS